MRDTAAVVIKNGRAGVSGTCTVCGSGMFRIGEADVQPTGLSGVGRASAIAGGLAAVISAVMVVRRLLRIRRR